MKNTKRSALLLLLLALLGTCVGASSCRPENTHVLRDVQTYQQVGVVVITSDTETGTTLLELLPEPHFKFKSVRVYAAKDPSTLPRSASDGTRANPQAFHLEVNPDIDAPQFNVQLLLDDYDLTMCAASQLTRINTYNFVVSMFVSVMSHDTSRLSVAVIEGYRIGALLAPGTYVSVCVDC